MTETSVTFILLLRVLSQWWVDFTHVLMRSASLLQSVVSSMSRTMPLAPAHVQIPYTPVISHVRKAVIVCCRGEISAEEPEHVASGIAAALSVQGKATPFYSITAKLLLLGAGI